MERKWPKLQRIFGRKKTKTSKSKERDRALISKAEERGRALTFGAEERGRALTFGAEERGRALTFGAERLTDTEITVNLVSVEDHQCASPTYKSIEDLEVIQKTLRDLAESTTPYNQGQIPPVSTHHCPHTRVPCATRCVYSTAAKRSS